MTSPGTLPEDAEKTGTERAESLRDGPPAYGFPAGFWRALERFQPPGLRRLQAWRSPLRGPWLTSVLGATLLAILPIVIITGLLDYAAYGPQFGQAFPRHVGWLRAAVVRLADPAGRGCSGSRRACTSGSGWR